MSDVDTITIQLLTAALATCEPRQAGDPEAAALADQVHGSIDARYTPPPGVDPQAYVLNTLASAGLAATQSALGGAVGFVERAYGHEAARLMLADIRAALGHAEAAIGADRSATGRPPE